MAELPMPKDYEGSVCEIKTMENELIAIGKIKEISQKYIKINNEKKGNKDCRSGRSFCGCAGDQ